MIQNKIIIQIIILNFSGCVLCGCGCGLGVGVGVGVGVGCGCGCGVVGCVCGCGLCMCGWIVCVGGWLSVWVGGYCECQNYNFYDNCNYDENFFFLKNQTHLEL